MGRILRAKKGAIAEEFNAFFYTLVSQVVLPFQCFIGFSFQPVQNWLKLFWKVRCVGRVSTDGPKKNLFERVYSFVTVLHPSSETCSLFKLFKLGRLDMETNSRTQWR